MDESGEALVPSIVRLFVNRKQLLRTGVSKIVRDNQASHYCCIRWGLLRGRCQTRIVSARDWLAKSPIRRKEKETGRG